MAKPSMSDQRSITNSFSVIVSSLLNPYLHTKITPCHTVISMLVGFCVKNLTVHHFSSCLGYLRYLPWFAFPIVAPVMSYKLWTHRQQNQRLRNTVELHDETSKSNT